MVASFAILLILPVALLGLYKLKPASASGRLAIYTISLNIIIDHPLTGIGPNRFPAVYNNYQSEYFKTQQTTLQRQLLADNTFENFNSILQILVEYGIAGFIILLLILYQFLKGQRGGTKIHDKQWQRVGSAGCIASIIVCSLFSNPFHVTPVLFLFLSSFCCSSNAFEIGFTGKAETFFSNTYLYNPRSIYRLLYGGTL